MLFSWDVGATVRQAHDEAGRSPLLLVYWTSSNVGVIHTVSHRRAGPRGRNGELPLQELKHDFQHYRGGSRARHTDN